MWQTENITAELSSSLRLQLKQIYSRRECLLVALLAVFNMLFGFLKVTYSFNNYQQFIGDIAILVFFVYRHDWLWESLGNTAISSVLHMAEKINM